MSFEDKFFNPEARGPYLFPGENVKTKQRSQDTASKIIFYVSLFLLVLFFLFLIAYFYRRWRLSYKNDIHIYNPDGKV